MDLIFWRHSEAFEALEGQDDMSRALTPRGEKQAARMGQWLDRQLPEGQSFLAHRRDRQGFRSEIQIKNRVIAASAAP